ncbi:hypothetical protein [Spirosoma sp. KNUC1025]|uniref:hypothetical protein n=1 Tax=Spirosoma sp. KNUC1025 TaxID=2894082 RepID=UPI003868C094|nr:hypothetical protein LN737_21055 [Spirosoma sp. KNUC1025]
MNKLTDQQIQQWLQMQRRSGEKRTETGSDETEFELYNRLFDELAAEPANTTLPYLFAANVTRQIQQQVITRNETRVFVLYGATILFIFLITGLILFAAHREALTAFELGLSRLAMPLFLLVMSIILIQWADYRFVKRLEK